MSKKTKILIFPIFITFVFAAFGGIAFWSEFNIRKDGVVTQSTVVDHSLENTNSTKSSGPAMVWYPVVEFYPMPNEKVLAKFPKGFKDRYPNIGEKLEIIYSKSQPTKILSSSDAYFIPKWILIGLVAVWLITATILKNISKKNIVDHASCCS